MLQLLAQRISWNLNFFSSPVVWTFVSQGAQIEFACRLAFPFYEHASDTCMQAMCGLGQRVDTGIR